MFRVAFVFVLASTLLVPNPFGYKRILDAEQPLQMLAENGELRTGCTTTAIGDGQHWLTAAHCTDEDTYIKGERTSIVYRDADEDLAVLKTVKAYASPLKIQLKVPLVGQKVYMAGHPVGLPTQYFQGFISSLATRVGDNPVDYMMFDMEACGGNSGSAVVNTNDEIVSVLQIGMGAGFGGVCSGFSGGAPWRIVAYVVQRYGKG